MDIDTVFKNSSNPKKVIKIFEEFRDRYSSGKESEKHSEKRMAIIKCGKKTLECSNCKRPLVVVERQSARQKTFRCKICDGRPEYSFLKNTPLHGTKWLPQNLLIAAFYIANAGKISKTHLSQLAVVDRATATKLILIAQPYLINLKVESKKLSGKKGKDSYYWKKPFSLLKKILSEAE